MLAAFVAWAVWWSFYQLWLTSEAGGLQLSGQDVGTVYAIHGIASVIAMIGYGAIQDRLDLKRHLVLAVSILMSLTGPFVTWVYRPILDSHLVLGAILGAAFLATAFTGSVGLLEAYVDRLSRRAGFEFGQARMFGSFGFALAALMAGFIFTINPILIFWVASIMGVILCVTLLVWKIEIPADTSAPEAAGAPSLADILHVCRDRKFWAFMAFILMSWTLYTIFESQMFPSYFSSLFATEAEAQRVFGALISAQTFLEAILMGIVPLLVARIGVRTALAGSVLAMLVPVLGSALFENPAAVAAAKLVHALMVPLIIIAVMKYIAMHFEARLSATIFLVGFYVTSFGASSILSNPFGRVRDTLGYHPTFWILAGLISTALIVVFGALRKDSEAHVRP